MPLSPDQVQLVRSSGSLLLGPGTPYTVLPGWDPWSRTNRAPQSAERPYSHGSLVGAEWVDEAVVLIPVSVYRSGSTKADWLVAHQQLSAAFTAVGSTGEVPELRFEWGGSEFVMFGRPRQVRVTADNIAVGKSVAQCAFVAPDPRIYSAELTTQSTGLPLPQGGLALSASPASTWLRLPGTSGSYASTPDHASLDITGDLEIGFEFTPIDWPPLSDSTVIAKYGDSTAQRSYRVDLLTTGTVRLTISTDGASPISGTSTVAVPAAAGRKIAVRSRIDVDNGASGKSWTFATGPSLDSLTTLGSTVTTAGAVAIFSGSAPLEIGSRNSGALSPFKGLIHRAQVRSGFGGTIVADLDVTDRVTGETSLVDATGKTWTVDGTARILADTFRGGLAAPYTINGRLVGGSLTIVNAGTTDTSLRARIDGPAVEPRLVLGRPDGTVQILSFDLDLTAGQWLDIDTAARTALLNGLAGSNQRGVADWGMDPYPVQPGPNTLRFASAVYNPTAQITAEHRSAWW